MNLYFISGLLLRGRVPRRLHRPARPLRSVPGPDREPRGSEDSLDGGDEGRAVLPGGLTAAGQLHGGGQREIRLSQAG